MMINYHIYVVVSVSSPETESRCVSSVSYSSPEQTNITLALTGPLHILVATVVEGYTRGAG